MNFPTYHIEKVAADESKGNDVIFAGQVSKAKANIIFFGGDVQVCLNFMLHIFCVYIVLVLN